ncbi:3700_t:CDS:2 [Ambispora gerdemannii]|uniref:3700_t:CDS:1 n=1 Tax=Ambispora gerdemannii TaxID=144530 RepID=A0A9N8YND8_9GLOM|nr:3700_t:CDS:2 [Ambispora gerdemannii]
MTCFSRLKSKSNDNPRLGRRQEMVRIHYSKPFSTTLAFTLTLFLIILSSLNSKSAAAEYNNIGAGVNNDSNSYVATILSGGKDVNFELSPVKNSFALDIRQAQLYLWTNTSNNTPPKDNWVALIDCDPLASSTIKQVLEHNPSAILVSQGASCPQQYVDAPDNTNVEPIFQSKQLDSYINSLKQGENISISIVSRPHSLHNDKSNTSGTGEPPPNRLRPSRSVGVTVLESFPVYLFSLGGVNAIGTNSNESEKDPKDEIDVEKGLRNDPDKINNGESKNDDNTTQDDDGPDYMAVPYESESLNEENAISNANNSNDIKDDDNQTDEINKDDNNEDDEKSSTDESPTPLIIPKQIVAQLQNSSKTCSISTLSGSVMSNHVTEEQLTCPICLGDFEAGEELRVLPCHHQYHTSCIDPWLLDISPLCPMCKADFTTWNIDVSAQQGSTDDPSASTISVDSSATPPTTTQQAPPIDNSDAISQISSIDDSLHTFPHFRWIKYLTAIRRAGRRNRRRSRRPNVRHSAQPPRIQHQHQRQQSSDAASGSNDSPLNRVSM